MAVEACRLQVPDEQHRQIQLTAADVRIVAPEMES